MNRRQHDGGLGKPADDRLSQAKAGARASQGANYPEAAGDRRPRALKGALHDGRTVLQARVFRQTGALGAGTIAGGLLAYVFFAMTTRTLGASEASPVSLLWTYWTMAAAILTFPLQHWTIRLLTRGDEGTVARSLGRIWGGTALFSLCVALLSYAARDVLFHDSTVAYPLMVAAITLGAALSGLVRGGLSGRGRFAATGASMAAENLLRVLFGVVVALTGGGPTAFGIVLVAGSLSGLLWPESLRFRRADGEAGAGASPLALASGLATGSLIAQVVLTGGPVAVAALGGTREQVTSFFVALAVWRAPYLLALGVAPQLTAALTRMASGGDTRRLQRTRGWVVVAVAAASAVSFLIGATIMEPLLRAVFGPDIVLDWQIPALIGAGTILAVGNLSLLLVMLVCGTSRPVNRAWVAALIVAGSVMAVIPLPPSDNVAAAFLAAEFIAFAMLAVAPLRVEGAAHIVEDGLRAQGL